MTVGDPQKTGSYSLRVPVGTTIPLDRILFLRGAGVTVGWLHVYLTVLTDRGKRVASRHFVETISDPKSPSLVVTHEVALRKGAYRLFVTVRDELTDEVGFMAKEFRL